MKHLLAALALLGVVVLPVSPAAAACDVTVVITNYSPASLPVSQGTTVTWCWAESGHSVTGTFADSGVRAKDATFTHKFTQPGTFAYVCTVHQSMAGEIEVEAAATPSKTPSKSPTAKPTTKPPTATRAATTAPPRAQASPTVIVTESPTPTGTPTVLSPPPLPPTVSPATATPSPAPTEPPREIDPAPAKPKTGLAIGIGLVLAAGALGGAGWLLLKSRSG